MDSLLSSNDVSSSKATGFASGLLSSLSSLFGTNPANAGVFADLLAEQGSVPVPPPQFDTANVTPPKTAPQDSDDSDGDSSTNSGPTSTLASLVFVVHRIINKLNQQANNETSSGNSSVSSSGDSSNTSTTGVTVQTQSTADVNSSSDTSTSDGSSGNDTSPTTPQTLTGLLSELTALMKYMEKKLQAAGDTGTASDTPDSTGTGTGTPDPLTQLLSLMHLIQQQLTASVGGGLPAAATSGAASSSTGTTPSPVTAALQDLIQIQKNLKGLLASFRGNPTGDASTTTGNTSETSSNGTSQAPINNLLDSDTANQNSNGKAPLATADSVFDLFGNLFANPFNNTSNAPAFIPVNANTLIAGGNTPGGSSNMAGQDNDPLLSDNGSANLSTLNADAMAFSGATDGAKSLNPYTFASQLSEARAANGGMTGLPDAVDQVILQLNRGVKSGNDQMTIQLQPAELGKISIKLDISSDGKVQGTVVATNPSTLSMLHKDVRSLERALQEAGLRADPGSLEFSLGGQSGNQTNQTARDPSSSASSDGTASSGTGDTSGEISVAADEIYYITPGRVNFKV